MMQLRALAGLAVGLVAVAGCGQSAARPAARQATSPSTVDVTRSYIPLAPSPRVGASMAFDPLSKAVVLFGGLGTYGTLDDTWSWDGARWHELHPAAAASTRMSAAMTYDTASHEVLMLSGESLVPLTDPCERLAHRAPVCRAPSELRDVSPGADLWGWNGHGWHLRLPANVSPHPQGGMVSQPDGSVVVLGTNGTWTYNGSVWQQRAPGTAELTVPVGIAVDPTSHQVIAVERFQPGVCMPHSGCQQPAYMRTFTWTGRAWQEVADRNTPNVANRDMTQGSLVADPAGTGLLLLADDHSTWRRTDGRWQRVATAAQSPPGFEGMTLVADPAHREVVGFGGESRPNSPTDFKPTNDTWIWNGVHWRQLSAPVTASPLPAPPAPADCTLNGPALSATEQAAQGATVRFTGSDLFVVPPCHLRATLTLTLRSADGQPLAVDGNPSTIVIDANAPVDAPVLSATWTWTHPCAPARVQADIKATGASALPTPFSIDIAPLPACANTKTSTLRAGPATLAASG